MARRDNADVETVSDDVETVASEAPKAEKAKKEPARGALPEPYVTPVGLTNVINERSLHTDKDGNVVKLVPQMTYSYIKNAPKDHPFPMEQVEDSIGKTRDAVQLEAGITWWTERKQLADQRRANAAQKKAEKAERAAKKAAEAPTESDEAVTEAE